MPLDEGRNLFEIPLIINSGENTWSTNKENTEPATERRSIKKAALSKFSKISQENTCVGISFLIRGLEPRPATLLKRDSNTGVFLRNL